MKTKIFKKIHLRHELTPLLRDPQMPATIRSMTLYHTTAGTVLATI
jgi:hypothetical protein